MDIKTGRELSSIFQNEASPPTPALLKTAYISFENENRSEVNITCRSPFETALWLEQILSNDTPPYNRLKLNEHMTAPVTFAMDATYYEDPDNRQRVKAGIILRFKDMDSEPELHLHGSLTGGGPNAKEVVKALKKAGTKWEDVNFIPDQKRPRTNMKIVR